QHTSVGEVVGDVGFEGVKGMGAGFVVELTEGRGKVVGDEVECVIDITAVVHGPGQPGQLDVDEACCAQQLTHSVRVAQREWRGSLGWWRWQFTTAGRDGTERADALVAVERLPSQLHESAAWPDGTRDVGERCLPIAEEHRAVPADSDVEARLTEVVD